MVFFNIWFIFRERGKEEEEKEKNIHVQEKHLSVAYYAPTVGDLACNPGMCSKQELNQRPLGLQDDTQTPTSQDSLEGFNIWLEMAEVRIHELEQKARHIIQSGAEREKIWK